MVGIYAGMYLTMKNGSSGSPVLTSQLSPLPNQMQNKVKAVLPHKNALAGTIDQ